MKFSNKLNSVRPHLLIIFFAFITFALAHSAFAGGSADVGDAPQALPGTEGAGKYHFMAPISALKGVSDVIDVRAEGFDAYIKAVFNFLIGLIGVFAVVRLVMVGFKMVMSPASAKGTSEMRSEITNIVISFVLVGGSFVGLNTINPDFVNKGLLLNPIHMNVQYTMRELNKASYDLPPGTDMTEMGTHDALDRSAGLPPGWYILLDKERMSDGTEKPIKEFLGPYPESGSCGDSAKLITEQYDAKNAPKHADTSRFSKNCFEKTIFPQTESEAQIRKQLSDAGVPVNKDACHHPEDTSCTTVGGYTINGRQVQALSSDTIGRIIALAGVLGQNSTNCPRDSRASACKVVITGGTEQGHLSHNNPYTFDMRRTSGLYDFIMANATIQAPSFNYKNRSHIRYYYNNMWWTDEDSEHFHSCTTSAPQDYCHDPHGVTCYQIDSTHTMSPAERIKNGINLTGDNVKYCK